VDLLTEPASREGIYQDSKRHAVILRQVKAKLKGREARGGGGEEEGKL
jgi:hypothetical protein